MSAATSAAAQRAADALAELRRLARRRLSVYRTEGRNQRYLELVAEHERAQATYNVARLNAMPASVLDAMDDLAEVATHEWLAHQGLAIGTDGLTTVYAERVREDFAEAIALATIEPPNVGRFDRAAEQHRLDDLAADRFGDD